MSDSDTMMRIGNTFASFIIGLIFAFTMMADEDYRPIAHAVAASFSPHPPSHPPSFVVSREE